MALRRKRKSKLEINVSSFSDIAFLLIIFFILTTTLVKSTGNPLNIPAGQEDKEKAKEKTPTINLTAGTISWGEEPGNLTMDDLRRRLLELELASREDSDRVIIINSAADVPYQRYFAALMAIHEAGGVPAMLESEEGTGR